MDAAAQQNFAFAFLSLLFEGIPFILLGTLVSGFIDIYMPPGMLERWLPKRAWLAVVVAALLGGIFPVCECAIVPVIRRLVRKGLPVSCALSFMLAAPIFNPITAYSTWQAFTGQPVMIAGNILEASLVMTLARCLLGVGVASLVGWATLRVAREWLLKAELLRALEQEEVGQSRDRKLMRGFQVLEDDTRLIAAMRSALRDFIDVAVYFSIGVAITALFNTGIAPGAKWLDSLATHAWGATAALMVLSFVLSLCSSSDAFIAATLAKFTYGAKLAFLTFGPMLDLKLFFLYQTVLSRRFLLVLSLSLFATIWGAAMLFQWYLNMQTLP